MKTPNISARQALVCNTVENSREKGRDDCYYECQLGGSSYGRLKWVWVVFYFYFPRAGLIALSADPYWSLFLSFIGDLFGYLGRRTVDHV